MENGRGCSSCRRRRLIARLILLFMVSVVPVSLGQSDIATGTVLGQVVDGATEEPLSGVELSVIAERTGYTLEKRSTTEGRFQIRLLPPGLYVVRAQVRGYAPLERRNVRVRVGSEVKLRLRLQRLSIQDEIVVDARDVLVETTRSSPSEFVDRETIEVMPLDGRDFKDLALLSPQVGQIGRSRFAGVGEEASATSFNIDGADANSFFFSGPAGGTTPAFTVSQAAIQEFQLLRSSYNVRFGGGSGVLVNAVTRRGENTFHRGAHLFFQDDSMVATDALGNDASDFERRQAGLQAGGPIRRDAVHFFLALDTQRRDDDFARGPRGLDPALRPAFDERLTELGLDPANEFDDLTTSDADAATLRLDWAASSLHRLALRTNWLKQEGKNSVWAETPQVGRSANGAEQSTLLSAVLDISSVLGRKAFNEAGVQGSFESREKRANSMELPWAIIGAGDLILGQPSFIPSEVLEDRLQVQEHLTWLVDAHTLRAGLDHERLDVENVFCFTCGGVYFFPSYDSFLAGVPVLYRQGVSPIGGRIEVETELTSLYLGDKWQVTPRLTFELGLRYQHQTNTHAAAANPLEPRTGSIPDHSDLAPRMGFAWDIDGEGRSVLRGGIGLFHGWTPSLLTADALLANGVNNQITTIFLGDPRLPRYPDRLASGDLGSASTPLDITFFSPDFDNPETTRLSVGVERAVGNQWTVGIEATYSEARHRIRLLDANLDPDPVDFTEDGRPVYGGPAARLDPTFGVETQFTSDAEARTYALTVLAKRQLGRSWSVQGHYTYSESRDHDTDPFDMLDAFPEDHFDLDQDWGPAETDLRHRVVVSGSWSTPLGLTLSFFGRYRSALPVNPVAGGEDLNNDGFFSDRPGPETELGLDEHLGRNSFRGRDWWHLDLRLAKTMGRTAEHEVELLVEAFNVTNEEMISGVDNQFTRGGEPNPAFLEPQVVFMPRTFQIGARYRF